MINFDVMYFGASGSLFLPDPETDPITIRDELARAKQDVERKHDRYEELWSKAYSIGAIQYDKDRVQSSKHFDIADSVVAVEDAKRAWYEAQMYHSGLLGCFRCYLTKAGFDNDTLLIWLYKYGENLSIGQTAKLFKKTRSFIQYRLNSRAEQQYLRANVA